MMRKPTVCACALVALLLLCSDASAHGPTYSGCGPVYGGYGYAASYGYAPSYYAPSYYAPSYGYAASYGYVPSYGYAASYGYVPSYAYGYAPRYGGYGYGGYGYGGYGYRYNPGGLGGPYSGLGVRPGLGLGGFGLRR
jgi:hypothetical protein